MSYEEMLGRDVSEANTVRGADRDDPKHQTQPPLMALTLLDKTALGHCPRNAPDDPPSAMVDADRGLVATKRNELAYPSKLSVSRFHAGEANV